MNEYSFNKKHFVPVIICVFLAILFIKNAPLASFYTKKGLEACFLTIIPSLFPLMVVSDALLELGFFEIIGRLQGNLGKKFFGISKDGFNAVLSGLILGFPVGARSLISLYDEGKISKNELTRTLGFSGIPSFAFLTSAVGASIFGSFKFGFFLYLSAIFSALITGIVFKKGKSTTNEVIQYKASIRKPLSKIITSAISASASATVILCAYVVFFSTVVECLSNSTAIDETKKAIIGSFLELSTGTLNSGVVGGSLGATICGASIGWSGLSVHFQTMSLCDGRITKYNTYLLEKAMQGIICGILSFLYAVTIGFPTNTAADISVFSKLYGIEYSAIMIVVFIFSFIYAVKHAIIKNKKSTL